MPHLGTLEQQILSSGTLAIKALAGELKRAGKEIIEFTAGEPDFPTPEKVKRAAVQAIQDDFTHYTAADGILELREAICDKLKKDNGLDYSPNQVIVTNGAKHAIVEALQVIINPGDEVLIPAPYWTSYPEQVKLCYGVPVIVDVFESNFKMTPEKLEQSLTAKTKAIILNSPGNPTGAVYTESEIRALGEVLKGKNVYVISDEIYEKIIFDGLRHFSIAQMDELYEQTIVINGFSKAYAMTGWRVGYAAGPERVIKAIKKFQGHQTSNVNSIAQKACLAALTDQDVEKDVKQMQLHFEKRRNLICDMMKQNEHIALNIPSGAFYVFPDMKFFMDKLQTDSMGLVKKIIEDAGIVTVPGDAFGAPGYIRFSYATSEEEIARGIGRFLDTLEKLGK
ncbi:MAG: pyridoxal phosphate-dependent aminotransferase [Calditrichia bacterium]